MRRIRGACAIAILGVAAFLIGRVSADGAPTTQTLAYSGALEESGAPVTGTRDLTLRFFPNEAAVNPDCTMAVLVMRQRGKIAALEEALRASQKLTGALHASATTTTSSS